MKQIKLQKISLVNFKGIKSLDLDFSDGDTLVCGENGSGKTVSSCTWNFSCAWIYHYFSGHCYPVWN